MEDSLLTLRSLKRLSVLLFFAAALFQISCSSLPVSKPLEKPIIRDKPKYTVSDRLKQYGALSRSRWARYFSQANVSYPPTEVTLVALKEEKLVEVYVKEGSWKRVRTLPICAASGKMGPKLREGDFQVPEGVYEIPYLNPNSRFHLSLRVNYPNEFDRKMAQGSTREGDLGGDIMIHGECLSRGCIAVGNLLAEDIFVLVADAGVENTRVIIAPFDLRERPVSKAELELLPSWTPVLYEEIYRELSLL